MPLVPGEYADLLRAIGRFLDGQAAEGVQLVNNEAFLTVSWRFKGGGADGRHYQNHNLEELRQAARDSRGDIREVPDGALADLLRTLGQDLDRERIDFTLIVQDTDGLVVSGSVGGHYTRKKHYVTELVASSRRRRDWRQGSAADGNEKGRRPESPHSAITAEAGQPRADASGDDDGPFARRLRRG
jgi:hypothetical protein